jgi:hypothetical protein
MRIALYVETGEDGLDDTELLLTAYVDLDESGPRMTSFEQCSFAEMPSRACEFLHEVLGSLAPTAGP